MGFSTLPRNVDGTPDLLTVLRDASAAAISATTSETGIALSVRDIRNYRVVVSHADISSVAADAYWTLTVEVSNLVGGTYTNVGGSYKLGATGTQFEIPLSGANINYVDSDAAFIRITATKTGTPGNLDYTAFIAGC